MSRARLLVARAGQRLVEQQQRGSRASAMASSSCRFSPWDSAPAGVAARAASPNRASAAIAASFERPLAPRRAEEAEARAAARLHRQRHVLQRGEARQHRGDLERAREAEPRPPVQRQAR